MSKYLKKIVLLLVFLLPILCNLVEHSASTILAVLILIEIYAWKTRKKISEISPNDKIIMWSFALYFLVSAFFFLANGLFRESASFNWNLDHELRFLAFVPIYSLFHRTRLKAWTIWYGSAIAAILCGFFSIYYVFGAHSTADTLNVNNSMTFIETLRVSGAYTAIIFGQLSLAFGFMSFAGIRYFHKTHPALTILPVAALTSGIITAFLSGTRGAIITIPFLVLIFFFQIGSFRFPWRNRIALVLAVTFLSAGLYLMPGSSMDQRFRTGLIQAKTFFNGEGTGLYVVRLAMWSEAWKIFKTYPVCGTGKNGYKDIIETKAAQNEVPKIIEKFHTPHNNYLTNMTAYGVTGLFMLLAIFLSPFLIFIPAIKSSGPQKDMAYTGTMLIVSFMLFAVTETIFYRNIYISSYIILAAAILHLTTSYQQES
jgi:O-antigen ligase